MKTTAKAKHCKAMNSIAKIGIIALAVIVTLSLTACGGGGASRRDFNGTWRNDLGYTMTITANEFTFSTGSDHSTTRKIDNVTPLTNTDARTSANYPHGFRFDGTVTSSTSVGLIGRSGPIYTLFMHRGKRELLMISNGDVYHKQ